ncbi:MAG: hypothetical protein HYY17_13240 [Planctomycetes bacterium]|nr:hypothetical protein [Planctomycetota bacterium]
MRHFLGKVAATAAGIGFIIGGTSVRGQESDEKLVQRVAALDKKLVKAFEDLAVRYDKEGDVEAASFFAECSIGLGSKEENIKAIKIDWELKVYLGRVQGGKVMEKVQPIRQKLDSLAAEYRKIVDDLVLRWVRRNVTKQELSEEAAKTLRECVVKHELARGAHEYVRTTQRFNELRRHMGLRSVLWDFENSRKTILGAWYAAETGDLGHNQPENQSKIFHTDETKFTLVDTSAVPAELAAASDNICSAALVRQGLLNANARRLWLGHWTGSHFSADFPVTAYKIPLLPYREDIPTPSHRYERGTIAKDWVDTEETVDVRGKRIPFVRYPHQDEPDAPWAYHDGQGSESGWHGAPQQGQDKCGIPIMLRFFGKATLTDLETSLTDCDGKEVLCEIYREGDKRVELDDWPTVLLLPETHLKKGAKYTVTVKCKVDGIAFEKRWSFTTRKK